jgi:hypothetical protein
LNSFKLKKIKKKNNFIQNQNQNQFKNRNQI